MIAEGIREIGVLVSKGLEHRELLVDGRRYTSRDWSPVMEPVDGQVTCTTLTGFSDLISANINKVANLGTVYAHVTSPKCVKLCDRDCDMWGRRQVDLLCVLPDYGSFSFGEQLEQEDFIIGLQAHFVDTPNRAALLKVAGKLTQENVRTGEDDGISQTVALRSGPVLKAEATLKPIVQLAPWRTFREIQQPASDFIFRLEDVEGGLPTLALHVADGEQWQLEAMQSIKKWIQGKHPELCVVA